MAAAGTLAAKEAAADGSMRTGSKAANGCHGASPWSSLADVGGHCSTRSGSGCIFDNPREPTLSTSRKEEEDRSVASSTRMATVAFNPEHPVSLSLRLFTFPSTGKFSGIQPTSKGADGLQAEEKGRRVLPFCGSLTTHSAFFHLFSSSSSFAHTYQGA